MMTLFKIKKDLKSKKDFNTNDYEDNSILLDNYPYFKRWLAAPHRSLSENLTNKISGYLTLSYSYKEFFTFNINGRFDASNKFGSESNNRFLPVWSISGMANLREIFFKNRVLDAENDGRNYWLSEARLRLSFGQQGNMIDGETPDMLLNQGTLSPYYNSEYVSYLYKLPNPNLRWEVTNQTNIGLDLNFWNGRLVAGLEFYLKKTHDLISSIEVSSVNGVPGGVYNMNNGDMSNKGFSISLSGYPIQRKNFKWYIAVNEANGEAVGFIPLEYKSHEILINNYYVQSEGHDEILSWLIEAVWRDMTKDMPPLTALVQTRHAALFKEQGFVTIKEWKLYLKMQKTK